MPPLFSATSAQELFHTKNGTICLVCIICMLCQVGRGITLPLEVFRCLPVEKGWGVRCREFVPAGTFVACYQGELLDEVWRVEREVTLSIVKAACHSFFLLFFLCAFACVYCYHSQFFS